MASQVRSTSPEGSFHGIPVSCTRRPGAWPTISSRALLPTRKIGFGSCGSFFSQKRHARASRLTTESEIRIPLIIERHVLAARRAVAPRRPVHRDGPAVTPLLQRAGPHPLPRAHRAGMAAGAGGGKRHQGAEALRKGERRRAFGLVEELFRSRRRAHQE